MVYGELTELPRAGKYMIIDIVAERNEKQIVAGKQGCNHCLAASLNYALRTTTDSWFIQYYCLTDIDVVDAGISIVRYAS